MNNGVVMRAVLCGLLAIVLVGCSSTDSSNNGGGAGAGPKMGTATPGCGTEQEPLEFTISGVSPALGASVPNSGTVQTFTIVGKYLKIDNGSFALSPTAHTAGTPSPTPIVWTYAPSGADTVYTSEPITWQKAGHVEFVPAGLLVTSDDCVSTFPTPVFSYDVTAP